jgi:hypothetical protein
MKRFASTRRTHFLSHRVVVEDWAWAPLFTRLLLASAPSKEVAQADQAAGKQRSWKGGDKRRCLEASGRPRSAGRQQQARNGGSARETGRQQQARNGGSARDKKAAAAEKQGSGSSSGRAGKLLEAGSDVTEIS